MKPKYSYIYTLEQLAVLPDDVATKLEYWVGNTICMLAFAGMLCVYKYLAILNSYYVYALTVVDEGDMLLRSRSSNYRSNYRGLFVEIK